MLPIKSNITSGGCIPTSSDCIIWQGPNIPCINLCTGDTVTDVTYKLAEKLCAVQSAYDLTPLNLNDLVTFCTSIGGAPTGTNKTLVNVLDFIVKKLGCVNGKVDAIVPGNNYAEPNLALPTCLQYSNGAGGTVTQLVHNQYTLRIATKYCELKSTVDGHSNSISNLDYRLTIAEEKLKLGYTLPKVTSNCAYPGASISAGQLVGVDVLVDVVESELCNLRAVLGTNTQIGAASTVPGGICITTTNLNSAPALAKPGSTLSSYTGWNSTVVNLAQSIQNLWITVLDMRCVINDLKSCCGKFDCSSFVLDFDVSTDSTRQNVTINFFNKMKFPSETGVTNGTGGNKPRIEITDGTNTIVDNTIDLVALRTNPTGITIPVAGTGVTNPLNVSGTYSVTVVGSIVKEGTDCFNKTVKDIFPPCASNLGTITISAVG